MKCLLISSDSKFDFPQRKSLHSRGVQVENWDSSFSLTDSIKKHMPFCLIVMGQPAFETRKSLQMLLASNAYLPIVHIPGPQKGTPLVPSSLLYRRLRADVKGRALYTHIIELRSIARALRERDQMVNVGRLVESIDSQVDQPDINSIIAEIFKVLETELACDNVVWIPEMFAQSQDIESSKGPQPLSARPTHLDDLNTIVSWARTRMQLVPESKLTDLGQFGDSHVVGVDLPKSNSGFLFLQPSVQSYDNVMQILGVVDRLIKRAMQFSRVQELNYIDDLTALYNQRYLYHALNKEIKRVERVEGCQFSVLFVDADGLKQVNDRHGHLVGSKLITEIGRIIQQNCRSSDYAFRYGGDEYILILVDTGQAEAQVMAERIRESVDATTFVMDGLRMHLTLSIGVACYPQHAKTAEQIIAMADKAMYDGKKKSRNTVFIAS